MQLDKCIFCQLETGDALHQVQTLEALSKVMLNAKNTSPVLCYIVDGIADLVATEAKYHLKCYVTFFRKTEKQNAGHEIPTSLFPQVLRVCHTSTFPSI